MLQIKSSDILLGEVVGQGFFSTVYKATWRGTEIAVKKIKDQSASIDNATAFRDEIMINWTLGNHPRVVSFLGGCTESNNLFMAFTFMPFGSMFDLLLAKQQFL